MSIVSYFETTVNLGVSNVTHGRFKEIHFIVENILKLEHFKCLLYDNTSIMQAYNNLLVLLQDFSSYYKQFFLLRFPNSYNNLYL